MASRIPSIAETSRDPGFPLAGQHISLLPAARVIVTEVSQLVSDNRGGESVGFARRTWGVTSRGLGLHFVVEQDRQVTDGGRVELAGGDLDRRGGDGSPAMSGLGRLVLGRCGPGVAVGAGHGERQAVSCRSGSVAVGRNRISMVTADVAACGRARMPVGEQSGRCGGHRAACSGVRRCAVAARTSCTAVGRFTRQPGWTTCGWALARVRTQYATTRCGSAAR